MDVPRNPQTFQEQEKVYRVRNEPDRTGWARMCDLVGQFDKERVMNTKEDVDTLLVFVSCALYCPSNLIFITCKKAGLFSAVVTAFIIESYKSLQQQPEDLTNDILMHLSRQIASLTLNGSFVNSTVHSFIAPSFQTPQSAVITNTLWVSSLVIALIAASLAILVKQWLHELLSYDTHDPMERLKLRFFREAGVERWKVFVIVSSLPFILGLAVYLFLIGLIHFFGQFNATLRWCASAALIIWTLFLQVMIWSPMFSSQCPYQTPILKTSRINIWGIPGPLHFAQWLWSVTARERLPKVKSWLGSLDDYLQAKQKAWKAREEWMVRNDQSLSLPTLAYARHVVQGEPLSESIGECIRRISDNDTMRFLEEFGDRNSPIHHILPKGLSRAVGLFALEAIQDDHLRSIYFGSEIHPSSFAMLYFGMTRHQSKAYIPQYCVMRQKPIVALTHLFEENPTSAVFSFLTLYSIRCRTVKDHPDNFDYLFCWLSDSEKLTNGIGNYIDCFVTSAVANNDF